MWNDPIARLERLEEREREREGGGREGRREAVHGEEGSDLPNGRSGGATAIRRRRAREKERGRCSCFNIFAAISHRATCSRLVYIECPCISIFRGLYRLWRATTGNWEVQERSAPQTREVISDDVAPRKIAY